MERKVSHFSTSRITLAAGSPALEQPSEGNGTRSGRVGSGQARGGGRSPPSGRRATARRQLERLLRGTSAPAAERTSAPAGRALPPRPPASAAVRRELSFPRVPSRRGQGRAPRPAPAAPEPCAPLGRRRAGRPVPAGLARHLGRWHRTAARAGPVLLFLIAGQAPESRFSYFLFPVSCRYRAISRLARAEAAIYRHRGEAREGKGKDGKGGEAGKPRRPSASAAAPAAGGDGGAPGERAGAGGGGDAGTREAFLRCVTRGGSGGGR